jgi:hypothetical protein
MRPRVAAGPGSIVPSRSPLTVGSLDRRSRNIYWPFGRLDIGDLSHPAQPLRTALEVARGRGAVYKAFCETLRDLRVDVATGVFGARMSVELTYEGPVTILLELWAGGCKSRLACRDKPDRKEESCPLLLTTTLASRC